MSDPDPVGTIRPEVCIAAVTAVWTIKASTGIMCVLLFNGWFVCLRLEIYMKKVGSTKFVYGDCYLEIIILLYAFI
jgi:hypothetical protein